MVAFVLKWQILVAATDIYDPQDQQYLLSVSLQKKFANSCSRTQP